MSKQSEQILEEQLIDQLQKLGYKYAFIVDEIALLANLKIQLEKHNHIQFSDSEFEKVLNILNKGSVFEKAKVLREKKHHIIRDNGDNLYFEFLNVEHWCQNEYQVTNQITQEGKYENRYDVTLLVNGLPLVQIELKRRGLEMKEAFNQINRYQKHSFGAGKGLFHFVQLFVISNGVNTKYFSNFGTHKQEYLQTFHWTDEQNNPLNNILNGFTDSFLEPCHISKMICKYIVLNETDKRLMVLRPYQYYAVESIIKKVKENEILNGYNIEKNGYIWHTTGSGKTLTSFKASQILSKIPAIKKVVFVVDRKDLDYQTNQEYDKFSKGSVSSATNTDDLIRKLNDPNVRIIVTTIQKLNNAISGRNLSKMKSIQHERMVFIFDECHRSQFGDTHKNIVNYFTNIQLFGFTGTPILAENADGEKTTASLFGKCLHKYVITDAIRDENVLKFSVEYIQTFKQKEHIIDLKVEQINETEVFEAPERKEAIVDYIIQYHDQKTQNRKFCAMMCVQDIDSVIQYYEIFKRKKQEEQHDLKIATIFSFAQNEEEMEDAVYSQLGMVAEPQAVYGYKPHRRELLETYVQDFNELFGEKQNVKDTEGFYNYYNAVAKKSKQNETDILLVANMFLTGFDSKYLNTLYVDKNLKYHGLIQAFSRTNRILDKNKTQGNIVCFRNLKDKTDEAIALFSNKEAIDEIIVEPYEAYVEKFNEATQKLLEIVPQVVSVDGLYSEEDQLQFILAFRAMMRLHKKMSHYTEFTWDDLQMEEQLFADYTSKYLDLKEKLDPTDPSKKASILNDIDFELELIRRDTINVTYILQLLIKFKSKHSAKDKESIEKDIFNLLNTEVSLRSKRELIEKFIQESLPHIEDTDAIPEEFEKFWNVEQEKALQELVKTENLSEEKTERLIENYLFTEREPLRKEILDLRKEGRPSVLKSKEIGDRILNKIIGFVDTFVNGISGN
ncbi:type I restriction endonuclease subunit R [Chryseobacterium indologenes]|uniref:Type I restriction enzyme endonuclease subunit n=1 Tax=Chryseobacterium oranimense TaxID=421058 RepID=A0A1M5SWJ3_9FLAO|nr:MULTISPECIES: type I restriction endonuclease subunit R [Chryseobacterium]ASE61001.1 type I restriction endonuclease subunit R [Chryseobacterium indologenes]QPQ53729.1 type I restriction endonuclease subunit R [Chryseobacterium indologenes]SFK40962.1 type I restriction enzyme, R subunit [Chryseobacterium indologenes]SHH42872.1 type I restriction enzyme, R subunit [Chryseobacterium oranimense]SUX52619.1 Type-1 restriction enzyme R protein [Chryseobacterium indologenes]